MRVAIIGAAGRTGSLIASEAARRGHEVTAFIRSEKETPAHHVVLKDAREIVAADLSSFDIVVNAVGIWEENELDQHDEVTRALADAIEGTATKLYIVGSAGSLLVDENKGEALWESAMMPAPFKPLASAMAHAFDNLRSRDKVNWIYVSPPLDFQAEGERKGDYIVARDVFTTNDAGESAMTYADFAEALVDIIEQDNLNQERISLLTR
ncbi:NAD(P)-dependent oxidoreductase [Corynebacterium cystitidis]|uniref:NAD(P)-binding domain-containing protein n=1 Tax=Corynebacterium cystitidis DSM 20524 TaxID=1121357 RepID=A0A1H9R5R7_9CORY|nr:NAD(P)H-binding protein [Corynebacterium cystitidis]WJY81544.1 hypothetical protein CCYS_02875 [Corynebacterium cystitidis DSM 20524]SER67957.1 hypothetical protein SAMN05661109_00783 [Corynebacterium cystitidis DSM 20524]SNV86395.1 NADH-flavin reductase [Corynebacterium cystitidis]